MGVVVGGERWRLVAAALPGDLVPFFLLPPLPPLSPLPPLPSVLPLLLLLPLPMPLLADRKGDLGRVELALPLPLLVLADTAPTAPPRSMRAA